MEPRSNISLSDYTSWNVGGPAERFALPETVEDLSIAVEWAAAHGMPITVLGGGTNVLVSDDGIKGLVLCLRKLSAMKILEENGRLKIMALSGTGKSELLKQFLKYKLAPALFLAGLPGDTGGGVVMNAGVAEAFVPREFNEIVDWIEVLRDGKIHRLKKTDLKWSYRHCEGWRPGIIIRVQVSWPLEPQSDIIEKVRAANHARLHKQPLELPSCGSVFQNPGGDKAGRLIEAAGLKGYKVGGAEVSKKHANFIVNTGGAKARDIDTVIRHVQATVQSQFGISLQTEVIRLGF